MTGPLSNRGRGKPMERPGHAGHREQMGRRRFLAAGALVVLAGPLAWRRALAATDPGRQWQSTLEVAAFDSWPYRLVVELANLLSWPR